MARKPKERFDAVAEKAIDEFIGFTGFILLLVALILMFVICLIVFLIKNTIFISNKFLNWLRTPLSS